MHLRILIVALSLLAVPTAQAAGEPLGPDNNIIWNQYTNKPSCCTTFGSTMKDDPLFSGSGNFGTSLVAPAAAPSFVLNYAITEAEFPYPVLLDPAGTIDFNIHLGGGLSQGGSVGIINVDVKVDFLQGGTVLATGASKNVIDHPGDGYKALSWSVAVPKPRLDPADGVLAWRITISGVASGVYISHTDANGNGWMTLPIVGVEGGVTLPAVLYETLEAAAVEHVFQNATSDDYVLNFTTDLSAAVAYFAVNGTGTVNATLLDATGTELFNGTASSMSMDLGNVTAGAWQLLLDYTDFNGTFAFALTAPAQEGTDGSGNQNGGGTGTGGPDGAPGGNETGNETVDGAGGAGKESPGVALPLLSIGLVAAAFVLRRRQ